MRGDNSTVEFVLAVLKVFFLSESQWDEWKAEIIFYNQHYSESWGLCCIYPTVPPIYDDLDICFGF